jgi:hypothetical protein
MVKRLSFAALFVAVVALPARAQIGSQAIQATYEAEVTTSFGTVFTDCFRFNVPDPKDLFIDGFGTPLLFRFGDLNQNKNQFQAITVTGSGALFAIMFHGKFGAFDRFSGQAVNEFGDTFVFSGQRNDLCPASTRAKGTNWRK